VPPDSSGPEPPDVGLLARLLPPTPPCALEPLEEYSPAAAGEEAALIFITNPIPVLAAFAPLIAKRAGAPTAESPLRDIPSRW